MSNQTKQIKEFLPPILTRKMTGLFYGWSGNYQTWEMAKKHSSGYDSELILNKVKTAALNVKNGNAVYERDSVNFAKIEYSFPLLSGLLWIACQNDENLNLIDFGGSLGSSYFQNKLFLDSLKKINWNIVEQSHFVKCGQENFQNQQLKFYKSIDSCLKEQQANTILFSSVLQYIEHPYLLIDDVFKYKFKYIIIDRTPFIEKEDTITVQKVHPKIYQASYPCWFFNENKLINKFTEHYHLITDFKSLDSANIKSVFKGFIFMLKEHV